MIMFNKPKHFSIECEALYIRDSKIAWHFIKHVTAEQKRQAQLICYHIECDTATSETMIRLGATAVIGR